MTLNEIAYSPKIRYFAIWVGSSRENGIILEPPGAQNKRQPTQKPLDLIEKDQGVRYFLVVPTGLEPVSPP